MERIRKYMELFKKKLEADLPLRRAMKPSALEM